MNPERTPIQTPAAPVQAAPVAPVTPAAPIPATPVAPSPFDNRGVEGAPHPGELFPAGTGNGPDHGRLNAAINPVDPQNPVQPVQNPAIPGVLTPEQVAAAAAAVPAAVPATPEQLAGVRGMLQQMGLAGVDQFADDQAALTALLGTAQSAAVLQQQLQAVMASQQQQAQLEAYRQQLAQQGIHNPQPVAPAVPAVHDPFKAPEWNPAWERLIVKGENGALSLVPGAPAEILSKYHAYQGWRTNFAEQLLTDPKAVLSPLIQQAAADQARQMVQSEMARQQTEAYTQSFLRDNAAWLYAQDAQGRPIRNPANNQPILSQAGSLFQGYLRQAEQMGVADIRQQERYAQSMLRHDYALQQYHQTTQTQQAQTAVQLANRRPNQGGTIPRPGVPQGVPQNAGLSLRDQMANALAEAGITDESLATGLG